MIDLNWCNCYSVIASRWTYVRDPGDLNKPGHLRAYAAVVFIDQLLDDFCYLKLIGKGGNLQPVISELSIARVWWADHRTDLTRSVNSLAL